MRQGIDNKYTIANPFGIGINRGTGNRGSKDPGANFSWKISYLAMFTLGLSDTTVLAIYRDILKISISRYFVINYCDTMHVHYCH